MTLLASTQDTLRRLRKASEARSGVDEAETLSELQKELQIRAAPLKEIAARASVLRTGDVSLTPVSSLQKVAQRVSNALARFKGAEKSSTLKQGKRWKELLEALESAERDARTTQTDDWKQHCSNKLFSGARPEKIREQIASTPKNIELLSNYRDLFKQYEQLRLTIPSDIEALEKIEQCSKALQKIKFDFDVPEDVKQFLAATQTIAGASLALLTDDVLKWLKKNKLLDRYVVRARQE